MKILMIIAAGLIYCSSLAQDNQYIRDTKSVDSIVNALYDVISGDAGEQRDWKRFNNLFAPDAQLIPTFKNKEGKISHRPLSAEAYEKMFSENIKSGFYEHELAKTVEEYGNIVHVFSTYETREQEGGPVTLRGINSIQLLKTDERYFIVNVFWSSETPENPIPKKYLR